MSPGIAVWFGTMSTHKDNLCRWIMPALVAFEKFLMSAQMRLFTGVDTCLIMLIWGYSECEKKNIFAEVLLARQHSLCSV